MVIKLKSISDEGNGLFMDIRACTNPGENYSEKKMGIWLIKIISQSSKMGKGAPSWDSG